ncbi:MAG TPA: OPT family oligopeptide transporter [Verrucomicrobiae bacterium]
MNDAPPKTAHAEEDIELPLAGFQGTPEEIERQWFEQVYKKRGATMPQLTWRAVLMGSALGGVLSLTNIYIGLKSGWLIGVAITACILSYAIWTSLYAAGFVKTKMSILENNCMQSTASSAGYSTGSTLISAFAAYIMINQRSLPLPLMLAWIFLLAVLGVTMAIPMKRQMINIEQLRFPSGVAAAETLRALHSQGPKGTRAARALCAAGVLAALSDFWSEGLHLINAKWEAFSLDAVVLNVNKMVLGQAWMGRTVLFLWDPVFLAAGVISGVRVGFSMILGGTLCWAVFVPIFQKHGVIAGQSYKDIVGWTLWGGVSCMVTAGLFSFLAQWGAVTRAMRDLRGMFNRGGVRNERESIETPMSWFFAGQIFSLIGLAILAHMTFDMPWWQSTVAVLMTFFLALVACRVTGETDTTPMGAMGKVTQLSFGVLNPGNMNVNLMAASITAGAAGSSADLLTDLKSGYLLGANPRKQFLAQFAGIFVGTLMTVCAFRVMVSDPSVLGTKFAVPSAQAWRAVALALSKGLEAMEPVKKWSIAIGGLLGILLPLLSKLFPKQEKYIPSAGAFGLAWTFQWYYSLLFFLGSMIGWVYAKLSPKSAEEFTFPVASGVIAGGALMGVFVIFADRAREALPALWLKLFH